MHRREFLATSLAAAVAAPSIVRAEPRWPEKPVRIVVPFAPGGSTDHVARPWAEKLTEAFGQQFVIENRGGASGMIGAEAVAKSQPDGYTFLLATSTAIVTLPLLRKVAYDPKAFVPVGRVGDAVTGFVVNPATGIKSFAELIEHARKNPGKLAFGSSGTATAPHLRFELMRLATGIDILHVPYRGGADTLNDLLAGAIQIMNESSSMPHVKAGKLTLLNISYPRRHPEYPDVPTLTELGYPGIDGNSWFGLYGVRGTPPGIFEKLNAKLVEIGSSAAMQARLLGVSALLTPQTLPEVSRHLEDDSKVTERVVRQAGIKIE
ncbi:MAG: Bug family tripartite tricarboxylate transporter substrate binding protein [Hyphomicrobiaceae bacterium]